MLHRNYRFGHHNRMTNSDSVKCTPHVLQTHERPGPLERPPDPTPRHKPLCRGTTACTPADLETAPDQLIPLCIDEVKPTQCQSNASMSTAAALANWPCGWVHPQQRFPSVDSALYRSSRDAPEPMQRLSHAQMPHKTRADCHANAKVMPPSQFNPDCLMASPHAAIVAPVVNTSSTTRKVASASGMWIEMIQIPHNPGAVHAAHARHAGGGASDGVHSLPPHTARLALAPVQSTRLGCSRVSIFSANGAAREQEPAVGRGAPVEAFSDRATLPSASLFGDRPHT